MIYTDAQCLAVNPFEGDFGEPADRVLRDRLVTSRKPHTCGCCRQQTAPGERIRSLVALFDGQLMPYRFCYACAQAMAASFDDDGEAWEARIRLGDSQPGAAS